MLHETRVGERVYAMEKLVGAVGKLEGACGANLGWGRAEEGRKKKRKPILQYLWCSSVGGGERPEYI